MAENQEKKDNDKNPPPIPENEKKMIGPLFWIVLGIVGIDDLLDVIVNLTGFGAPIASFLSFFVLGISLFYMLMEGISLNTRFAIRGAINFLIELIPFVSFLPGGMLFLILTRLYENDPKVRALVGAASLGASKIGSNVTRTSRSADKINKMATKEFKGPNITRFRKEKGNDQKIEAPIE